MSARHVRRLAVGLVATTTGVLGTAGAALACGGLIGENGSIQLSRTTTLAGWHDGVEHYITAFSFTGSGESVGSIIPLPGVPDDVVGGSNWTLQRLQREVTPTCETCADTRAESLSLDSGSAEVLLETEVDALDITVLRGGADAVGEWALDHGFFLTPDAPEVLEFYAERSQIFLAAKFDAGRAADQGLVTGQATPVHITMPLDRPWVPLRILGLGLPEDEVVQADVFLLTDDAPELLAGGEGLRVERRERATDLLLDDLRSDEGMEWVPDEAWFTHLVLDERAGDLDYDLATGTADEAPSPEAAGLAFARFDGVDPAGPFDAAGEDGLTTPVALVVLAAGAVLVTAGVATQLASRRRPR